MMGAPLADHRFIDIPALGAAAARLPVVLRILLENIARTCTGEERDAAIRAILDWEKTGTSEAEIEVQPVRVLMHDTTSTPALVDIAAWHWMYEHPDATQAQLREATLAIARSYWDKYYAPVLGKPGNPQLAIYSHIISQFLYP